MLALMMIVQGFTTNERFPTQLAYARTCSDWQSERGRSIFHKQRNIWTFHILCGQVLQFWVQELRLVAQLHLTRRAYITQPDAKRNNTTWCQSLETVRQVELIREGNEILDYQRRVKMVPRAHASRTPDSLVPIFTCIFVKTLQGLHQRTRRNFWCM